MTSFAITSAPGARQSCGSTSQSTTCNPRAAARARAGGSDAPYGGRKHVGVTPSTLLTATWVDEAVRASTSTAMGDAPLCGHSVTPTPSPAARTERSVSGAAPTALSDAKNVALAP